jgi:hypothetical protein
MYWIPGRQVEIGAERYYTSAVTRDSLLRIHLPGILLIVALLVSLLLFVLAPPERVRRTLFFPGTTDLSLRSESRLLPRTGNLKDDVRLVVEDVLLGPARIEHGRLVARSTEARSLILDGETLYVDLSSAAIDADNGVRIGLSEALQAIRRAVLYNFRSLNEVVITIDGQAPFEPAFREARPIGN